MNKPNSSNIYFLFQEVSTNDGKGKSQFFCPGRHTLGGHADDGPRAAPGGTPALSTGLAAFLDAPMDIGQA